MCVAYPGRVIEINDGIAVADFAGNQLKVRVGVVEVKVGDYVLVHAGLAIEVMPEEKAKQILEAFEDLQ